MITPTFYHLIESEVEYNTNDERGERPGFEHDEDGADNIYCSGERHRCRRRRVSGNARCVAINEATTPPVSYNLFIPTTMFYESVRCDPRVRYMRQ